MLNHIEKNAVLFESSAATVVPHHRQHFFQTQVEHFKLSQASGAHDWLTAGRRAPMRTAA